MLLSLIWNIYSLLYIQLMSNTKIEIFMGALRASHRTGLFQIKMGLATAGTIVLDQPEA